MNNKIEVSYSFGNYLLDVSKKQLFKNSDVIPLTPKAFDTLLVLVSNKGRVVEKNALLDEVWANTFVGEGTLSQNILTLRKTLGISEEGKQFIETVPRRGYRFIADVRKIIGNGDEDGFPSPVKPEPDTERRKDSSEETIKEQTPPILISSPKTFIKRINQNKAFTVKVILAGILICAAVVFSARYILQPKKFAFSKFNKIEVSRLTSDGNLFRTAISRDGKYLAFAENRGGDQLILIKQTDDSAVIEIVPPKKQMIIGLTFSPDGKQIYFAAYGGEDPKVGRLFRIPMLGGIPQEILANIDGVPAISSDGRQIAFIRNHPQDKQSILMVSDIDGGNEKEIAARNLKEGFSLNGLSWSRDDKIIACPVYLTDEVDRRMDVLSINAATGEQQFLTKEKWLWIGQLAWLSDGSGIMFPGWNSRSGNAADEIWLVSTDGRSAGNARQVSSGINGVFSLSITADSNSVMAIKTDRLTDFLTSSAPDFKQSSVILQNSAEYDILPPGVNFLADNRIIFGSTFNGNLDIWRMNPDGSVRQQLTTDKAADFFPVASEDGQTIVFISNRTGRENLWRMKADGSRQEQITNEARVTSPSIAPDGRTVYYSSREERSGRDLLRKINLETGESATITSLRAVLPRLSPDGRYIACYYPEKSNNSGSADDFNENNLKLTILLAENGEVVKQFDAPDTGDGFPEIEWKGSQSICYPSGEGKDIKLWEQPINGEKTHILLDLTGAFMSRFAWSPDGQKLVYEKASVLTDAILINSKD